MFKHRARAGETFEVSIVGNGKSDLDLEILDPTGASACRRDGPGDRESCRIVARLAGEYTIFVRNLGSDANEYRITIAGQLSTHVLGAAAPPKAAASRDRPEVLMRKAPARDPDQHKSREDPRAATDESAVAARAEAERARAAAAARAEARRDAEGARAAVARAEVERARAAEAARAEPVERAAAEAARAPRVKARATAPPPVERSRAEPAPPDLARAQGAPPPVAEVQRAEPASPAPAPPRRTERVGPQPDALPRAEPQPPPLGPAPRVGSSPAADVAASAPATTAPRTENVACAELGIAASECDAHEQMLKKLKEAKLLYNRPHAMNLGEPIPISLLVNPVDEQDAKAQLDALPGELRAGRTKVARHMSAELNGGAAFEVDPKGPQQREFTWVTSTRWDWKVTPKVEGEDQLLTLDIYVHLVGRDGSSSPIRIHTYRDKIRVDVSVWKRVSESLPGIAGQVTALGAILGALWGAYVWWRKRSWNVRA